MSPRREDWERLMDVFLAASFEVEELEYLFRITFGRNLRDDVSTAGVNLKKIFRSLFLLLDDRKAWVCWLEAARRERSDNPVFTYVVDDVLANLRPTPAATLGPSAPPVTRGWPLLLPNGKPFVNRQAVKQAITQMIDSRTPRV